MPESSEKSKKAKNAVARPRGFYDILPEENEYWRKFHGLAEEILLAYGFAEMATPILEYTSLFKRTLGETSDVVSKEMFSFTDRSRDSVTLRPEFTAGIARAYIEHGMFNRPQPVKLWSFGPLFRYDRPQAGRQRQFHQLDLEIIGSSQPAADAEIIFLAALICGRAGLEVSVQINSLGSPESRREYLKILKEYYRAKKRFLCDDCKERLGRNPLRLLDCKQPACQEPKKDSPQLVDNLDEESKQHFVKVLEYLDESEVPYVLNPYIVRGLDYYNRTAFEIWPAVPSSAGEEAAQIALGGGGRYDGLIETLGGRPTPAAGLAFGVERLLTEVKRARPDWVAKEKPKVFLARLGEEAAKRSFLLFEKLRASGIKTAANFAKEGLKAQLELADKLGVAFTVILGQKELLDGTIIIRDMENGMQEVVDSAKIDEELKKRLAKKID